MADSLPSPATITADVDRNQMKEAVSVIDQREYVLDRDIKGIGELQSQFETWIVLARLDGMNRLPGDADLDRQVLLREVVFHAIDG